MGDALNYNVILDHVYSSVYLRRTVQLENGFLKDDDGRALDKDKYKVTPPIIRMEVMGARAVNTVMFSTYVVIVIAIIVSLTDRGMRLSDVAFTVAGNCTLDTDLVDAEVSLRDDGESKPDATCQFAAPSAPAVADLPHIYVSPRIHMHAYNFPFAFEMEIDRSRLPADQRPALDWTGAETFLQTDVQVLLVPSYAPMSLRPNKSDIAAMGALPRDMPACDEVLVRACAAHTTEAACESPEASAPCHWCPGVGGGVGADSGGGRCWPSLDRAAVGSGAATACLLVDAAGRIGYTLWSIPVRGCPAAPLEPLALDGFTEQHSLRTERKKMMQLISCDEGADGCSIRTMALSDEYRRVRSADGVVRAPHVATEECGLAGCNLLRTSWLIDTEDSYGRDWQFRMLEENDQKSHSAVDSYTVLIVLRNDRELTQLGDVRFKMVYTNVNYIRFKSVVSLLTFFLNAGGLAAFLYFCRRHERAGGVTNREQKMVVLALVWSVLASEPFRELHRLFYVAAFREISHVVSNVVNSGQLIFWISILDSLRVFGPMSVSFFVWPGILFLIETAITFWRDYIPHTFDADVGDVDNVGVQKLVVRFLLLTTQTIWNAWFWGSIVLTSRALSKHSYLESRYRQLSFRFLVFRATLRRLAAFILIIIAALTPVEVLSTTSEVDWGFSIFFSIYCLILNYLYLPLSAQIGSCIVARLPNGELPGATVERGHHSGGLNKRFNRNTTARHDMPESVRIIKTNYSPFRTRLGVKLSERETEIENAMLNGRWLVAFAREAYHALQKPSKRKGQTNMTHKWDKRFRRLPGFDEDNVYREELLASEKPVKAAPLLSRQGTFSSLATSTTPRGGVRSLTRQGSGASLTSLEPSMARSDTFSPPSETYSLSIDEEQCMPVTRTLTADALEQHEQNHPLDYDQKMILLWDKSFKQLPCLNRLSEDDEMEEGDDDPRSLPSDNSSSHRAKQVSPSPPPPPPPPPPPQSPSSEERWLLYQRRKEEALAQREAAAAPAGAVPLAGAGERLAMERWVRSQQSTSPVPVRDSPEERYRRYARERQLRETAAQEAERPDALMRTGMSMRKWAVQQRENIVKRKLGENRVQLEIFRKEKVEELAHAKRRRLREMETRGAADTLAAAAAEASGHAVDAAVQTGSRTQAAWSDPANQLAAVAAAEATAAAWRGRTGRSGETSAVERVPRFSPLRTAHSSPLVPTPPSGPRPQRAIAAPGPCEQRLDASAPAAAPTDVVIEVRGDAEGSPGAWRAQMFEDMWRSSKIAQQLSPASAAEAATAAPIDRERAPLLPPSLGTQALVSSLLEKATAHEPPVPAAAADVRADAPPPAGEQQQQADEPEEEASMVAPPALPLTEPDMSVPPTPAQLPMTWETRGTRARSATDSAAIVGVGLHHGGDDASSIGLGESPEELGGGLHAEDMARRRTDWALNHRVRVESEASNAAAAEAAAYASAAAEADTLFPEDLEESKPGVLESGTSRQPAGAGHLAVPRDRGNGEQPRPLTLPRRSAMEVRARLAGKQSKTHMGLMRSVSTSSLGSASPTERTFGRGRPSFFGRASASGAANKSRSSAVKVAVKEKKKKKKEKEKEKAKVKEKEAKPNNGMVEVFSLGYRIIKVIEKRVTDTHLYIARRDNIVVVVFRGTKSMKNAKTDLRAGRVVMPRIHLTREAEFAPPPPTSPPPPRRRASISIFGKATPASGGGSDGMADASGGGGESIGDILVHGGFWHAYSHVSMEIVDFMRDLLKTQQAEGGDPLYVFCAGHSLGGALATLCALELRQRLGMPVELYTFGSPRVGSPAFARLINRVVPRSYRFVNDMDVIPTVPPRMLVVFEHVGKEIIIDSDGNFIFDPMYVDQAFYGTGRDTSLADHKVRSYVHSLDLIYRHLVYQHGSNPPTNEFGVLIPKVERMITPISRRTTLVDTSR